MVGLAVFAGLAAAGCFVYWQHLKTRPEYTLSLIVHAAQTDDRETLYRLIDSDAVVDDMAPQVMKKAAELYGRGLPPQILSQLESAAAPLIPLIKGRVRNELPAAVKQRTSDLSHTPRWLLTLAAPRYLDVTVSGETASVRSKLPEHTFEVKMKKVNDVWVVVGVTDEAFAKAVAEAIGESLIKIIKDRRPSAGGLPIDPAHIDRLLKKADDLLNP